VQAFEPFSLKRKTTERVRNKVKQLKHTVMRAFRLFAEVTRNGIDNTMMAEYRHSSEITLQDFFG
jgi:hypothetical protein